MAENGNKTAICSSSETEDWLEMELAEEDGCNASLIAWCQDHARTILPVATIALWSLLLAAVVFG